MKLPGRAIRGLLAAFPVLALLCFPSGGRGQSAVVDIRGTVTDTTNGERLPGVNVTVEGTGRGWVTNVNGFYLIAAIPHGRHTVSASAVGFRKKSVAVNFTGTEPITLNLALVPRVIESSEITIEGETDEESAARGASIHVVTPHDLQQIPAAAQPDLFRTMELLPGVSTTSDVNAKFYVRGGAGDQNLVLLDGMKLFNPFHAYGAFGVLDPAIIKSADVYTGAFPANYGDRLSSVINVTTRDGNRSTLAGDAGINFLSANLGLEGPIAGDNSWLVSARKSLFDRTLQRLIPAAAPTSFYDFFFKGTAGNSTGRVSIRGFLNDDRISPADPAQPDHEWKSASLAAVVSGLITDRIYMDLTLNLSTSSVTRTAGPFSPVPPASSRISEWSFRGEFDVFPETQDHFAVGFESAFPSISNVLPTRAGTNRPFDDNEGELWLWFRYIASLGPLGIDAGIHTELSMISGAVLGNRGATLRQILQPRLSASYGLSDSWAVKAAYGVYTQNIITINNEDDLISLFDAWVYLPDRLRPEEAEHFVLGVEGGITHELSTSVQAYVKNYRSIALYNPDKIFPDDPDYISGTGISSGIEALLRYSAPGWGDFYGAYVLSRARVTTAGLTYPPRYDQSHQLKGMAVFHLPEGIDVTLRGEYGSGYPYTQNAGFYSRLSLSGIDRDPFPAGGGDPMRVLGAKNAARLPAYRRLDAGISVRFAFPGVRGHAGVNLVNLLDTQNILYYDRVTGKTDYMMPFFPSAFITAEF